MAAAAIRRTSRAKRFAALDMGGIGLVSGSVGGTKIREIPSARMEH